MNLFEPQGSEGFTHLFTSLPRGVVSKYDIGDRRTRASALEWRLAVERRQASAREIALTNMATAGKEMEALACVRSTSLKEAQPFGNARTLDES